MKAAAKREALVSKVLARLYPHEVSCTPNLEDPNLQAKVFLRSNGDKKDMKDSPAPTEYLQDAGKGPPEEQKVYTANLPPENHVQSSHDCVSSAKGSEESEDTEGLEEGKRFRRRRRKKKVSIKPQAEAENDNNMLPKPSCPQTSDRVPINKNKRRKLQRKRQKERLKAAGLWTKTKATDPNHQCKEETVSLGQPSEEHAEKDLQKKSEDLLDFLNATQELYFTDVHPGRFKCANDTAPADAVFETLNRIKSGEMPSSDVTALHHLKTLVLLQDIERLEDCLDSFKEHSALPVDHRVVLCSLFRYWITDILPMRKK
uniref:Glutamate rich 1 n=1 Tax=Leptobrachium leishanense TaxID=445787 RepID=A0A8C5N3G6_9ANUR